MENWHFITDKSACQYDWLNDGVSVCISLQILWIFDEDKIGFGISHAAIWEKKIFNAPLRAGIIISCLSVSIALWKIGIAIELIDSWVRLTQLKDIAY